jgi:NTE family protein
MTDADAIKKPANRRAPAAKAGPAPDVAAPATVKALNVALQGGGAHGAFGWGVLDRLLEDERVVIEGISATSAGAMNAVVYAYGKQTGGRDGARALLETFWRRVSEAGRTSSPLQEGPIDLWLRSFGINESLSYRAFETVTHLFSPYEFNPLNLNPLRSVVESVVDFERLRLCTDTVLRLCATNVRTGQPRIFVNREVSADAVMASACLPHVFQAVELEGEAYWDGGFIGNPAIYPLIYDAQSRDILIVHINPIVRQALPRRASEILNRVNEISFNSSLVREMRAIAFVSKLIDADWLKPEARDKLKRIYIHAIRTDDLMTEFSVASKFNTDWRFLTRLRDLGRSAASTWLATHYDRLGQASTVDIAAEYIG